MARPPLIKCPRCRFYTGKILLTKKYEGKCPQCEYQIEEAVKK